MSILQQVTSLPTAPFCEQYVVDYVRGFAKARGLKVQSDASGNLLLQRRGRRPKAPRWVFAAHMDHPGFVSRRMIDAKTLHADFRGNVMTAYLARQRVRFFAGREEITGVVISAESHKDSVWAASARIRISGHVPAYSPGMFEQGVGRIKGGKFLSRACDDLAGAAAALEMLDRLDGQATPSTIAVLLTRAEEEGFVGAIAAARDGKLLRRDDRIIAIETSAMQAYARQGDGAIIRIGDKTSIFNSALTYFLTQQAAELAKKERTFKYQRALMPGGTCEATVYDVFGFHAASICVALGNYHNMNRDAKKIGPEYIDFQDWKNMVRLFLQIAANGHTYEPGHKKLRLWLEKRFEGLKPFLGKVDLGKSPTAH